MIDQNSQTAPSKFKTTLLVLLPVLVILGIVFAGLTYLKSTQTEKLTSGDESKQYDKISIGQNLDNFEFFLFKDGAVSSEKISFESLNSKVVLINFWANWCQSCMVEMPSLVKLHETYRDQGFEILGVNVDENPVTAIPKTLKRFNIGFLTAVDSDGVLGDFFDVNAIPFSAIILKSKSNEVVLAESGERDWFSQEVREKLEGWLKE